MSKIKISDLTPDDKNYNKGTQFGNSLIEKSLRKFGAGRSILLDKNNRIIAGNKTIENAYTIGLEDVLIVETTGNQIVAVKRMDIDLDSKIGRELALADNASAKANIDWDLKNINEDWTSEESNEWGIDNSAFVEELEAEEDDFDEAPPLIPITVLGDLYEIGEHRLLCGDSIDSDSVFKLMNGKYAELLFTSPPYSDMREYNGDKDLSISNIVEFITSFYQYCEYQVINLGIQRKEGEIFQYWNEYINKAKDNNYKLLSWNIWNRENAGFSIANITSMFATQHEWIFVFGKKVKKLNLTIENKEAGNTRNEVSNRQKDGSVKNKKAPIIRDKRQLGTINTINPQLSRDENVKHPAMFPVELPSEYIKAMTDENDIIVEPFTGSGTTMISSHQLNRKCYGMELDPKYCDVIVKRMIKLDDSLTIKRNGIDVTKEFKSSEEAY